MNCFWSWTLFKIHIRAILNKFFSEIKYRYFKMDCKNCVISLRITFTSNWVFFPQLTCDNVPDRIWKWKLYRLLTFLMNVNNLILIGSNFGSQSQSRSFSTTSSNSPLKVKIINKLIVLCLFLCSFVRVLIFQLILSFQPLHLRLPNLTLHLWIHFRIFRAVENFREFFQILNRTIYTKQWWNMSISFDLQIGCLISTRWTPHLLK